MGLFKSDLYRSFAIGFAIGAAALYGTVGIGGSPDFSGSMVPSAVAATIHEAR